MLRRAALLAFLLTGQAAAAGSILTQMGGTWVGDDLTLVVDGERMLANADKNLPFQRDPLVLKNVSGSMVVFDIGKRQFIGLFNQDELNLTGDGITGSAVLRRQRPRAGAR
jgi:hypothetical protein